MTLMHKIKSKSTELLKVLDNRANFSQVPRIPSHEVGISGLASKF